MDCEGRPAHCDLCNARNRHWRRNHLQLQSRLEWRQTCQVTVPTFHPLQGMRWTWYRCQCGADNCTGFLGAESVLWRKTAQAVTKKRMLFSDCFTSPESIDVGAAPLDAAEVTEENPDEVDIAMCTPVSLRIPNAVIVPRTVVTRSKVPPPSPPRTCVS